MKEDKKDNLKRMMKAKNKSDKNDNAAEEKKIIKENVNMPIRKGLSFIHFGIDVALSLGSTSIESSCGLLSNALSISARIAYAEENNV